MLYPLHARIFFAPAYYQRLKHMVVDKNHSRSRGPVQLLTRQPNEGRARNGGLRFGEMERDCIIAHGAADTAREMLYDKSDPYATMICKSCGMLSEHFSDQAPKGSSPGYCRSCQSASTSQQVGIPYAMKLLLQELTGLHIVPKFRFADPKGMSTFQEPDLSFT